MNRLLAGLLLLAAAAGAEAPLDSETQRVVRAAVDGGGEASQSATHALEGSVGEDVAFSTSASASYRLRAGWARTRPFPGPVADLTPRSDVTTSSVTFQWTTPGYEGDLGAVQAGSQYLLRVASYTVPDTFADSRHAGVSVSTSGPAPGDGVGAGATGLQPNTTYYARLWLVDSDGGASEGSNVSTFTTLALPVSLQPQSFVRVHFTSVTVHWVARPSSPPDASSKTAAGYRVEASSTNFGALAPGGVVSSSETWFVSQSTLTVYDPDLIVDRDYYFRVATLNKAGQENWTLLGSTRTKFQVNPPVPADPPYPLVSTGALTVAWDRNGNPSNAEYHAEVSPSPGFSPVVTATDTYELSYSTGGLSVNTTYYFRVYATTRSQSSGYASLGSTSTWSHPPAAAGTPFPALHVSSLTARWLLNGNQAGQSTYTVVASTSDYYPNEDAGRVVLSSTKPAGSDPMATLTGLSANTTYYLFAASWNRPGALGGFVLLGSAATRPAPPASAAFQEASYSSATASWSANGNPLGVTTFTAVLSTVAAYPPGGAWDVSVDTVPDAASPSLPLEGLRLNTTYYLSVAAVGHAATALSSNISTTTLAAVPDVSPDFPAFASVSTGGFVLNWSSGTDATGHNPDTTRYVARVSTMASFVPMTSSQTFNVHLATTGLSANTTYYARVAAYSHRTGTWTASTDYGPEVTLAAVPATAASTFTGVHFASMTVRWLPGGNPVSRTTYTVVLSPETPYPNSNPDNVVLTTAPAGAAPSAGPTGLNAGTTYYLFVAAENHAGVLSAYAVLGSTRTKVAPKHWVGGVNGSWHTAGNWSPSGVPGPTDSVTIAPAANIHVTAAANQAAISFSSLTVGGVNGSFNAHLLLSTGVASAGSVLLRKNAGLTQGSTHLMVIQGDFTMLNGSSMTHTAETSVLHSSVNVRVTGTFDLQAGSSINVMGRGYRGGAVDAQGFGPGRGGTDTANNEGGGGAGYGGAGGKGAGSPGGAGGPAYGSLTAPVSMGSGGGGGGNTGTGGTGGGIVIIDAQTMILDGVILSSGNTGRSVPTGTNAAGGGGGSGGGVFITAVDFSGGGRIDVQGGPGGTDDVGPGGGGGGGRAAIVITGSGVSCRVAVSTAGGASGGGSSVAGTSGTFHASDLLAPPQGLGGTPLTATDIDWGWSLTNGATDYQLFASTGGPMSPSLGAAASYSATGLSPNTTYQLYVRARACGANAADSDPAAAVTLAAAPAAAGASFTGWGTASLDVAWSRNGDPVDVTTYTVVLSPQTPYPNGNPGNVVVSTAPAGSSPSASVGGLAANTTYYLFVSASNHAGLETAYTALGSASTLAEAPQPGLLQFLAIHDSSVTVAWAAGDAEGYVLRASSNDFGALPPSGAPVFSSTTYSALASTLTVGSPGAPLDLSSTYYFEVGSLNWEGRANYSTLQRLNFQLRQSTNVISLGVLGYVNGEVAVSTISRSSMVVTNVGNWPATIVLSAAMITEPSSPWTLSTSSGPDVGALLGLWYEGDPGPPAVGPPPVLFADYITGVPAASQAAGRYASPSQNGYQLPPGERVTLWLRFFLPTSSTTLGPEKIQVLAQPVYP